MLSVVNIARKVVTVISCYWFEDRFYHAALNAGRSCREKGVLSVRPSVHLSIKCVDCDKNGRKICPDFYTI